MNILSLLNIISYYILILYAYKDFLATFILYINTLGCILAHSVKMHYEIVFKSDRMLMLYLPSSNSPSCCSNASEEGGSWYSSGVSTSTHDRNAKTWPTHAHTCKQWKKIRNSTTIQ
jgi:hypothetical protein